MILPGCIKVANQIPSGSRVIMTEMKSSLVRDNEIVGKEEAIEEAAPPL